MALSGTTSTGYGKTTTRVVPFDATKFRDSFKSKAPAVNTYFSCSFDKLPAVLDYFTVDGENQEGDAIARMDQILQTIAYRVLTTDLPSRALSTTERILAGPSRQIVTGINYSNLQVEFIEGQEYDIRWFFDKWQAAISNDKSRSLLSGNNYRVAYYDDLVIPNFYIDLWDRNGNNTATYQFKDVFPVAVYPNQMTWQSSNQVMSVPIELSYHEWSLIKPRWSSTPDTPKPVSSLENPNNTAVNTTLPTLPTIA